MTNLDEYSRRLQSVATITLLLNIFLSVIKVVFGVIGYSNALIADGLHSFSDAGTTVIVIIGAKVGGREADDSHPYGHERYETICMLTLSVILILVGGNVFKSAVSDLLQINQKTYVPLTPSWITLIAAGTSIIVKELMYRYTMINARAIHSTLLEADAVHHRSDALSSVGSLLGIVGMQYGIIWADALASLVISLFIAYAGVELVKIATDELVDHSASPEELLVIAQAISGVSGVEKIDNIKSRKFADKLFIDVEISVDGSITVSEGHEIAEKVHIAAESVDKRVKHCNVHVNPY